MQEFVFMNYILNIKCKGASALVYNRKQKNILPNFGAYNLFILNKMQF